MARGPEFIDRREAGRRLAEALIRFADKGAHRGLEGRRRRVGDCSHALIRLQSEGSADEAARSGGDPNPD